MLLKKIKARKQQFKRFLFGSFTATALMFTFQACYGVPNEYREYDAAIRGVVTSERTGKPIRGIVVRSANQDAMARTGNDGRFTLPVYSGLSKYQLSFIDEDAEQNGCYANLDTIISAANMSNISIKLQQQGAVTETE